MPRSVFAQRVPGDIVINRVLQDPYVRATIANPKFTHNFDVPYGAGPNKTKDGVVNIDRHVPQVDVINGRRYDPARPTAIHEIVEQHIADQLQEGHAHAGNQIYEMAHHAAERAERMWVEKHLGPTAWGPYQQHWAQWLAPIEHENPPNPPPNLDLYPYPHRNVHDAPRTRETEPVFARAERRIGVAPTPRYQNGGAVAYQAGGEVEEEEQPERMVAAPTLIGTSGTGAATGGGGFQVPPGYEISPPERETARQPRFQIPPGYEIASPEKGAGGFRIPPGYEIAEEKRPKDEGAAGTVLRETAHEAVPLAAGVGTAALTGAGLGMLGAGPIGGFVGAIGGGIAGGIAASGLQEWALKKLGLNDEEQRAVNREAHPYAALAGEAALPALFGRPSAFWKAGAAGTRLMESPRVQAAAGALLGGGLEAGQEYLQGQDFDPKQIAAQAASMGVFSGAPTRLGRALMEPAAAAGERIGARFRPPEEPLPGGKAAQAAGTRDAAEPALPGGGAPQTPPQEGQPSPNIATRGASESAVNADKNAGRTDQDYSKDRTQARTEEVTTAGDVAPDVRAAMDAAQPEARPTPPPPEPPPEPPGPATSRLNAEFPVIPNAAAQARPLGEPATFPRRPEPPPAVPSPIDTVIARARAREEAARAPEAAAARAPDETIKGPEFFVNKVLGKKQWQIVDDEGNNRGKTFPNEKSALGQADKWKTNPDAAPEGKAPRAPRAPAVYKRLNLWQFIASKGGISADEPRLSDVRQAIGGGFVPGFGALIRKKGEGGLTLDKLVRAAIESRHINDPAALGLTQGPARAGENALLEALPGGRDVFPNAGIREPAGPTGRDIQEQQELPQATEAVLKLLRDTEYQGKPNPQDVERAAKLVVSEELDPESAWERAVMADNREKGLARPEDDEYYRDFEGFDDAAERRPAYPPGEPAPGAGEERAGPGAQEALPGGGEQARPPIEARAPTTEQTPQGEQFVLPGAERISDAELVQRRADERLRPTADQRPADEGLFGERAQQTDLSERQAGERGQIEAEAARYGGSEKAAEAITRRIGERVTQIERGTIPERELPPERMGRVETLGMARGPRRPMPPDSEPAPPPGGGGAAPGTPTTVAAAQAAILGRVAQKPSWLSRIPKTWDEAKAGWRRFYEDAKNDLDPLEQLEKQGPPLTPQESFYTLARLTRGLAGRVRQQLELGTYDIKTGQGNGISLDKVLAPVEKDPEGFTAYALAKHAIELEQRGINSGIPMPEANAMMARAGEFEPVLRELVGFQDRVLDNMTDIVGAKGIQAMRALNKSYVPFYRMLDPKSELGQQLGVGRDLKVRDPIYEIKGSDRPVFDPIDSIVKNTYLFTGLAERNRVLQALEKWDLSRPEGDRFLTRSKDVHPITVTPEEINRFMKQQGIPASVADTMQIFRPDLFNPKDDKIRVFNDGKAKIYDAPPAVARAINGMNRDSLNMLTRILATPARMLRAGAVLSPEFILRNPIRDQFSALAFSKYGYVPVYDMVKGLGGLLKKDADYQNWMTHGGANANLVSLDRSYISQNPKDFVGKLKNVVTNPLESLRMISELMENSTRLGIFKRAIEAGASPTEAAFQSREGTLDFARLGAKTQAINSIIPFFNAQVEGVDRAARAFRDNRTKFLATVGMSITMPSVLLWMANKDDPRWKELPEWQKDLFWIIPTDKWVPMNATDAGKVGTAYKRQLPNGQWQRNDGTIWRIPKPFELGVLFGSVPERVLDAFFTDNPHAFKDLHKSVGQALFPGFLPQAAAPLIEQFANRSMFLDRPLVPKYLEGLQPKYQATPYTSETAKVIGNLISNIPGAGSFASPAIIDNYIRQWSGGLGQHVTSLLDKSLQASGVTLPKVEPTPTLADMPGIKAFVARFPSASVQSVQDFYDTYDERKKTKTTADYMQKHGQPTVAQALREANSVTVAEPIHKALGAQFKAIRNIYEDPKMSADDKRQNIDLIYLQAMEIAKRGNAIFDRTRRANP